MPRTTRTTIVPNLYADNHGFEIIVSRKGREFRKRYHRTKTVGWLKNELQRQVEKLEKKAPRSGRGMLEGDVALYLKTLPDGRPKTDRDQWLAAWLPTLGELPRDRITAQMVRETMAGWRVGKKQDKAPGPSTLNHRLHALKALYLALDGPEADTPCDHIRRVTQRREIRVIPRAVVVAVLRRLPPCATTARLKLLARTGWPQTQIAGLQPHDINYTDRLVRVKGRKKGGGTKDRIIPVTYAAVRALHLMERHDAWGEFSRQSMYKTFALALRKARDHWPGIWPAPKNFHPYDMRHAFITHALKRSGGNLLATSVVALHSDVSMTAFYAGSAAQQMAVEVRDAMDRRAKDGTRAKQAKTNS